MHMIQERYVKAITFAPEVLHKKKLRIEDKNKSQ